jgi:hypothetical protein
LLFNPDGRGNIFVKNGPVKCNGRHLVLYQKWKSWDRLCGLVVLVPGY